MSEVDTPDSSAVRLKGEGEWPTFWVVFLFIVLVVAVGHLLYGIYLAHWTWPTDERRIVRGGVSLVAGVFNCYFFWDGWRNSVIDAALSAESFTISTRAKQTVLPVNEIVGCELIAKGSLTRIRVRLLLKTQVGTESLEVIVKRKMDPLTDLQLLPDLQRRGVEIIGVEDFVREIERLTGKSAAGLFTDPRTLQAGGLP